MRQMSEERDSCIELSNKQQTISLQLMGQTLDDSQNVKQNLVFKKFGRPNCTSQGDLGQGKLFHCFCMTVDQQMMPQNAILKNFHCKFSLFVFAFLVLGLLTEKISSQIQTRDQDQFIISDSEKLLITVHIWGEVKNPGQYRVRDDVNILELISLAGGPTEFSDLKKVKLARGDYFLQDSIRTKSPRLAGDRMQVLNIQNFIDKKKVAPLPILGPGDVVYLPRNMWYKMQTVIRVVSQLAIVAQVWYWYSRS